MNQPYQVSVITAVLNGGETLARVIASVTQQDYPALEYVVVDGGSTDGTLEVIDAHRSSIDVLVNGPDGGIAEAMNKGVAAAKGDLVIFLHADDRFVDANALSRVMKYVHGPDRVWACDVLFGGDGLQRRLRPRPFNSWARLRNPLPHQGVIFPRRLFDRLGGFDPRLQISMDYELWLRAMALKVPLGRIPETLSVMGSTGVSSRVDWAGLQARFDEERSVQERHAPSRRWRLIYHVYWPVYLGYRRLRGLLGSGA